MKFKCTIRLSGCDDNTSFEMELNEEEFLLLKIIEETSKKVSHYSCMPTFKVEKR